MDQMGSWQKSEKLRMSIIHSILIIGSVAAIAPFLFMLMNSVKQGMEIMFYPEALPSSISFEGYRMMFRELKIINLFKNTLIIIIVLGVFHVLFNAAAAYALAKIKFAGRDLIFKIMLSSMMLPSVIMTIPTYMMMYNFHWVDSFKPLIIPAIMSAYNIFLLRQFITQIPNDFIEAAKLDGANHLYIFIKIILPMSVPILSTISVLLFMGQWNDLFGPLLYLRSEELQTIQVGLWRFNSQLSVEDYAARWAGLSFSTLPVIIVFLFAQKYFVRAFTGFGLK